MFKHRVDKCPRIRTFMHKAHLANATMNDIGTVLLKLIRINRECTNIAMSDKHFGDFTIGCVVEKTICINALVPIFKPCMSENIMGTVMLMIPNKWYFNAIINLKGSLANHSTIRTLKIISGCPAAEIAVFN